MRNEEFDSRVGNSSGNYPITSGPLDAFLHAHHLLSPLQFWRRWYFRSPTVQRVGEARPLRRGGPLHGCLSHYGWSSTINNVLRPSQRNRACVEEPSGAFLSPRNSSDRTPDLKVFAA